jgi:hypothetical protein
MVRCGMQAALFYGAVLGLTLSLGSLHLQRGRREAAGAIELAQQQAQAAVRAQIRAAVAEHVWLRMLEGSALLLS